MTSFSTVTEILDYYLLFSWRLKTTVQMFTIFPYRDVAFWSAWSYSVGSVLFILDAAFGWLPLAFPGSEFPGERGLISYMFFFGATLYEIGAVLAYLLAINDDSFHGTAIRKSLQGREGGQKRLLEGEPDLFHEHRVTKQSTKHYSKALEISISNKDPQFDSSSDSLAQPSATTFHFRRGGIDYGTIDNPGSIEFLSWQWWPSWHDLMTRHLRDIGWWACSVQLLGATIYSWSSVIAVSGTLEYMTDCQAYATYWIPVIAGGCCFLTASVLFTLATQEKWHRLEPRVLGWWIGIWSGVGSIGFTLCALFAPAVNRPSAQYQSYLSLLWGSTAYLISASLQWYECVNRRPIQELLNEPGVMKSYQVHPV